MIHFEAHEFHIQSPETINNTTESPSLNIQQSLIIENNSGIQCESLMKILNQKTLEIIQRAVYIGKTIQNCVLQFDLNRFEKHDYFNLILSRNKCKKIF